jgi:predicted RNA-binding Zn-ribbon protein involved in translation (DUF1610 family)
MFFNKKTIKCESCKSKISQEYSYCPYCGEGMIDSEKISKEFGMLGKNDAIDEDFIKKTMAERNLTLTDKMISAMVSGIMNSINNQMKDSSKAGVQNTPRGIKIQIGFPGEIQAPQKKVQKHDFSINKISDTQLERLKSLPKTEAKTNVKRLGDKLVYELSTPGLSDIKDVFVSKLEKGYEIRAISEKKVYVNSLPVNMNIKSFSLEKDKLTVEFIHN